MRFRIPVGIFFAIGLAMQANADSEFEYSIPTGWRDLRADVVNAGARYKNIEKVPPSLLEAAASGQYAVLAIEPMGTTRERAGAVFNAVERPPVGRVTPALVSKLGADIVAQYNGAGLTARLVEARVVKLNGVNVARFTLDADGGTESQSVVQYVIPGRKGVTVLTFLAPKPDFATFLPVFEASARATQGGHEPPYFKFRWTTLLDVVGSLAILAFGLGLMYKRRKAKAAREREAGDAPGKAPAAAPPTLPKKNPATHVWTCPACGKPVPARLEQCRCGAAKPA
jgi:hypothetical protein